MPVTKPNHHNRNRTPRNPYKKPKPKPTSTAGEGQGEGEAGVGAGAGAEGGPSSTSSYAHKIAPLESRSQDQLPGLSKIKASIRQTKRLLAKDTLEPGLRVQTQRRLTSLEADLATVEKREVAKKNGARYHMVKFFDRQKLLRIIKRLHRKLSEEGKSDKKRARFEKELGDARVMLNYVLHFPNTQKYISLFPSSASASTSAASLFKKASKAEAEADEEGADGEPKTKLTLPALLHPVPKSESLDKPSQRRYEILLQIRKLMEEGSLSEKPEDEVKDLAHGQGQRAGAGVQLGADIGAAGSSAAGKGVKKIAADEEKDDFFDEDSD